MVGKARIGTVALMVALALGLLAWATPARAQTSRQLVSFQGRLTDLQGNPVTGEHLFEVRILDAAADGNQVYYEARIVTIHEGFYEFLIGSGFETFSADAGSPSGYAVDTDAPTGGIPASVVASADLWLETEVDEDGPLTPRTRLASVPFAMRAGDADTVGGLTLGELAWQEPVRSREVSAAPAGPAAGDRYIVAPSVDTWERVGDIAGASIQDMLETSAGHFFVAIRTAGFFYRSTDDGNTWTIVHQASGESMAVCEAADGSILAGAGGFGGTSRIYRSTDGGSTWTQVADGDPAGANALNGGDFVNFIVRLSSGDLFAGLGNQHTNEAQLARSTDNGATWAVTGFMGVIHAYDMVEAADGTLYLATYNKFFRSVDGGNTWEDLSWPAGGYEEGPRAMAEAPDGALYVVSVRAGVYRYEAGSLIQVADSTDLGGVAGGQAITVLPDGRVFVGTSHNQGAIYVSGDRGATWNVSADPDTLGGPYYVYSFLQTSGGALWVGRGWIHAAQLGGGPWTGQVGNIAQWDGSNWQFSTPDAGTSVFDANEGKYYTYDGSAWEPLGASPWAKTGSNISYEGGRVGVGTDDPRAKLHVKSSGSNDGLLIETTDTETGRASVNLKTQYGDNAGDFFRVGMRGDLSDAILTVKDASTDTFHPMMRFEYLDDTIDASNNDLVNLGKVGIGTKSPLATLNVSGDEGYTFMVNGSTQNNVLTVIRDANPSPGGQTVWSLEDADGGAISFHNTGAASFKNYIEWGKLSPEAYGVLGSANQVGSGNTGIKAAGTNADIPIVLLPKGSGGVGIGTTTPGGGYSPAKLVISQTDETPAFTGLTIAHYGQPYNTDWHADLKFAPGGYLGYTAAKAMIRATNPGGNSAAGRLSFWTTESYLQPPPNHFQESIEERMVITGPGNVGINRAAPTHKLEVGGNAADSLFQLYHTNTTGGTTIMEIDAGLFSGGLGADGKFINMNDGGNTRFRFMGDGQAYADGSWNGGGADYAEWFAKEGALAAGDVVGLHAVTGEVRRYRAGDRFIGIHATAPGFVGNQDIHKSPEEMAADHALVGLAGQMEVDPEQVREDGRWVYTLDGVLIGSLLADGRVLLSGNDVRRMVADVVAENEALRRRVEALEREAEAGRLGERLAAIEAALEGLREQRSVPCGAAEHR